MIGKTMKKRNRTAMAGWKHSRRGWWYFIKYDEASNTYAAKIGRKLRIVNGGHDAYPYMNYVFNTHKAARAMCLRVIGEQIWCYSWLCGNLPWHKRIDFLPNSTCLIERISSEFPDIYDIKLRFWAIDFAREFRSDALDVSLNLPNQWI